MDKSLSGIKKTFTKIKALNRVMLVYVANYMCFFAEVSIDFARLLAVILQFFLNCVQCHIDSGHYPVMWPRQPAYMYCTVFCIFICT